MGSTGENSPQNPVERMKDDGAPHPPDPASIDSNQNPEAFNETVDLPVRSDVDWSDLASKDTGNSAQSESESGASDSGGLEHQSFGRYRVQHVLGKGAFGAVYLGLDEQLDRRVAIKTPRIDAGSEKAQQEFLAEARQLAKLNHPGIVSVYDIGIDHSQCYIVSNFLDGPSLDRWLKDNRVSWQQAVQVAIQLAEALAHAHSHRVVHRDLKPANVIMTDGMTPVIVDFGLALSDAQLTGAHLGIIAGTPSYMAPEQARGEGHRIDGRTDIYALGVILYRMLTRQLPFQSRNVSELLRQVQEDDPQPPRQLVPDLPKEVERVCLKAMARSVRHRYTTAGDMAEELQHLLNPQPRPQSTSPAHVTPTVDSPTILSADHVATEDVATEDSSVSRSPSPQDSAPSSDRDSKSGSDSFGHRSSSRRSQEALRRRITIVHCGCDVFTSDDVLEVLDIEEQQEVLIEFQEFCRKLASDSGGTVFQTTTDGLLICFGFPVAYEDASRRGVICGWQLLGRMDELNRRLTRKYRVSLQVYAVVHCDQAIVQDRGESNGGLSIVGQVINTVNQLSSEAEADSLIVTEDTQKLVRHFFEWESLGLRKLRGVGQKTLFRVTNERAEEQRSNDETSNGASSFRQTPLIGRNLEVGLLQERWEQAVEGMGQVVLLIGEAGLGKSRLVQMLKEHARNDSENAASSQVGSARDSGGNHDSSLLDSGAFTASTSNRAASIVEWRSSSQYQNSSLSPVIDYFERLCRFERSDSPDVRLDKLIAQLAPFNFDGDLQVALLASLLSIDPGDRCAPLGLDPQRQKERTFELLVEWLRELSYAAPVLFIIEDLHWMDPTTLEFLEDFVSHGFNDSILTLLTFRPEFVTPWQSMAHQTQIALNRLTRRQIAEMVVVKAGHEDVPQNVIDQIIERTDGVPLFVEEFTQMVIESGATVAPEASTSGSGSTSASSNSGRSREIPATLQDLLTARLDRIDANIEVAQLGAAIGREFSHELISAASPFDENELLEELDKLVSAEVLLSRGRESGKRYSFKHALIQDAAYGSLVKQKRQNFHQRIGEAVEARFPDVITTQPELLAMHFTEAGNSSKAIAYWEQAGARSLARRAHKEAIEQLRRGLALLELEPETPERFQREIDMHTALGVPLQATIGYSAPEVEQTYSRAHELCSKLGLTTEQFPILYGMFRYYMLQAKYPKSRELGTQLLAIAEQTQTPHYIVAANRARGGPPVYEGRHTEAVPFLQTVVAIEPTSELRSEVDRYDVVDPWIASHSYLSWATWLLGYPDQSLAHSNQAVQIAEGLDHSFSAALAISFSQWVHQFRRDVAMTRSTAEKALAISKEHGFAFWYGWCEVMLGWAIGQQGKHDEAIAQIQQGISDWRAQGSELGSHYYYAMLAEVCVKGGRYEEAIGALNDGKKFATDTGEGFYASEIPRIRGRLILRRDSSAIPEAEACYHESLELAREQQARSLELRTARSLAQLWKSQGRNNEARELLSPILDWFTEGSDTYDLQRSHKLLASLDSNS